MPEPLNSGIALAHEVLEADIWGREFYNSATLPTACTVASDSEWVVVNNDELQAGESLIDITIEPSDEPQTRQAVVTITRADNPRLTAQFTVRQRGYLDYDDNALASQELTSDFRVGWGYNIAGHLMSVKSVTKPILDYNKLVNFEKDLGEIVAEEKRQSEDFTYYSGYSAEELSQKFASAMVKDDKKLFAATRTVSEVTRNYSTAEERCFGYARLAKIVATRYLDEGKVEYLIRHGADIFSTDFLKARDRVLREKSTQSIKNMFDLFGTHLVVRSDLGGMMEYMMDFEKKKVVNVETYTEIQTKYLFGKKQSSSEVSVVQSTMSSFSAGKSALTVEAGDPAKLKALQEMIARMSTTKDQLDSRLLSEWLSSFGNTKNLTVVHCTTLPIWMLFTDETLRKQIRDQIEATAVQIAYSNKGSVFETNSHFVDISKIAFSSAADAPLVKTIYRDKTPIIEVCNEYVPNIRSDRRVTIFYPIVKGKPNIAHGIFPGDGQNPPAWVGFSGGDSYVVPAQELGVGDVVRGLYYIKGGLYFNEMGAGVSYDQGRLTTTDNYLTLTGDDNGRQHRFPFVKIGSGYWTRSIVNMSLAFGQYNDWGDYDYMETLLNGIYYSNCFYDSARYFTDSNDQWFGFGRARWFVPRVQDMNDLVRFMGNNLKAFFPRQQSGFEAQFVGSYGRYDNVSGKDYGIYGLRNGGTHCIIPFKDDRDTGTALILGEDYTLRQVSANAASGNRYPVYLFRTSEFVYNEK